MAMLVITRGYLHKGSERFIAFFGLQRIQFTHNAFFFGGNRQCCDCVLPVWFQTSFIFHNTWDNPSQWLIFFRGVETTNQSSFGVFQTYPSNGFWRCSPLFINGWCLNRTASTNAYVCSTPNAATVRSSSIAEELPGQSAAVCPVSRPWCLPSLLRERQGGGVQCSCITSGWG